MRCPVCVDVDLAMSDRQGIEIDYCPKCRGVWLDRGELDKIIDRSSTLSSASPPPAPGYRPDEHRSRPQSYGSHDHGYHKKKKKGGLLGELFDF